MRAEDEERMEQQQEHLEFIRKAGVSEGLRAKVEGSKNEIEKLGNWHGN